MSSLTLERSTTILTVRSHTREFIQLEEHLVSGKHSVREYRCALTRNVVFTDLKREGM